MRVARRALSSSSVEASALERVWKEATVRVVRSDETDVCRYMEDNERVHDGVRDVTEPRSWLARIRGPHRFCFLLEHGPVALAYLLVSVSPVPASNMPAIFEDTWSDKLGGDERGNWRHCNFYSVTALNKDPTHAFHGVPVGFPCIRKGADFLLEHGVRDALQRKKNGGKRRRIVCSRRTRTSFILTRTHNRAQRSVTTTMRLARTRHACTRFRRSRRWPHRSVRHSRVTTC